MPVEGFVFSLKTVVSIRFVADVFFSFICNFSFLNKLRINKNHFFPFLICNNSKTITFKRNDILSKLVSKQRSGENVVSVKWRCCCYCRECWQLNLFKLHRIRLISIHLPSIFKWSFTVVHLKLVRLTFVRVELHYFVKNVGAQRIYQSVYSCQVRNLKKEKNAISYTNW